MRNELRLGDVEKDKNFVVVQKCAQCRTVEEGEKQKAGSSPYSV